GVYAPNVSKLLVFGGERVSSATVVDTTRIYDIATNTWSTGAPMPDVRAFMASGYYNGKIYLVGGYSTAGYVRRSSRPGSTTRSPTPSPLRPAYLRPRASVVRARGWSTVICTWPGDAMPTTR